jgi:gentisate 1,2-dioxygenase
MLKRSHIVAAEEDLQAFYQKLEASNMAALWGQRGGTPEPKSKAVPFVWHWQDVRSQAMRAAELVAPSRPSAGYSSLPTQGCRSLRPPPL